MQKISIILIILLLHNYGAHAQRTGQIQCESKQSSEKIWLILNCTSTNSQSTDHNNNNNNNKASQSNTGQTSDESKLGMTEEWRAPWYSIRFGFSATRKLIMRHSRVSHLGAYAFKDLTGLQRIDLSHNRLVFISPEAFDPLEESLLELDLSFNHLDTIAPELLSNAQLARIEILNLSNNRLTAIASQNFANLTRLRHLDLSNNLIKSVDPHSFHNLPKLETLLLNSNHIRTLSEALFKDLPSLKFTHLHDNLLQCDCNLRWLIPYLKALDSNLQSQYLAYSSQHRLIDSQSASLNALKCDQPNSLKSIKSAFIDINPDSFMCDVHVTSLSIDGLTTSDRTEFSLGDEAVFMCEVYGDPEPNIYWAFGDRFIEKSLNEDKYLISDGRAAHSPNNNNKTSQLRVVNLQPADAGLYKCVGEIGGSSNRKEVTFNIRSIARNGAAQAALSLASMVFNFKSVSNWTLVLLVAIAVSICVFTLLLITFVCIKCKRMSKKGGSNGGLFDSKTSGSMPIDDEEERKDLVDNATASNNNECIYGNVNSIRHAPKKYSNGDYFNESNSIYATNNTETLLLNNSSASTLITPRYQLVNQHNGALYAHVAVNPTDGSLSYYDDLKTSQYDESSEAGLIPGSGDTYAQATRMASMALYSSPMRHVDRQYSPNMLHYATVKSKMNGNAPAANYVPYSTIYRQVGQANGAQFHSPAHQIYAQYSQPQVQVYANPYQMINSQPKLIHPVQVAVPIVPPVKPKRTFEHQVNGGVGVGASSATSLDEDLDLNDLKDFEDVTFDNLRKPAGKVGVVLKEKGGEIVQSSGSSTLNSNPMTQMTTTTNTLGSTSSTSSSSTASTTDRSTKSLLQIKTPEPVESVVVDEKKKSLLVPEDEKIYEETEI